MKKVLAIFSTLFVFLTMFATTTMAAGEDQAVASYEGPLILLSVMTLGFMIFLIFTDNN
ncbi:hypothetical protein [Anaerobacillus arseniciselenatis]|uniref:hypothetical protein n=1 Tax=Anaerobacillus arseniciselenatis TaxID=85682 RepID=UPI0014712983|nr:hypothetical protein [Anaerobacillus arseniciselenatis]